MHKGRVKRLIRDRGFGFISDSDGREVFFHKSSLVGTNFESLGLEDELEFDVEKSDKGPYAVNVKVIKK
ncbi:MAG: cold shock domain-containing protein [Candidatus Omnitrophica bacterium]|nr:cold shock domain-containing protein [Candidatus Omnitrophota bacterium]